MDDLRVQQHDNYLEITLNRPEKKNALTAEMLFEIERVLHKYQDSSTVLPVIIRGSGREYFCSGYNINEIPLEEPAHAERFALSKPLDHAVEAIESYPYPTFALLNGSVYGGGCEIAFSCDFRIGLPHIRLCMPPAKIGLIYSINGLKRIASVIGISNLKKLIFTAEVVDYHSICKFHAIDYEATEENVDQLIHRLVQTIEPLSPLSLRGHKTILNSLSTISVTTCMESIFQKLIQESYLSRDAREGKKAFLEKRKPVFKGY